MKARDALRRSILVGLAAVSVAVILWSLTGSPHAMAETRNPRGLAVIIGNGEYRGRDIPPVDYAGRDAEAFRRYVVGVLGFDAANVIQLRNATKREMLDVLGDPASVMNDIQARLNILSGEGDVDVVVYYSGHGVPGKDGQPFLLPVDVPPHAARSEGYSIDLLYRMMGRLRGTRSVRVFLDTCFSGSSDGGRLVTGSPVYQETAFPETVADRMMVLTAVTKTQIATWDKKAKHGLFTHHLLDALYGKADGDGDGKVTGVEAKKYLDRHMTAAAWLLNRREQQATLQGTGGAVLARADRNGVWRERPVLEGSRLRQARAHRLPGGAAPSEPVGPVDHAKVDLAAVTGGKAILVVRTEPAGAAVLVSGAKVGETPLDRYDLRAGTYTVALDHPTHETVILEDRILADKRVLSIERRLEPASGDVTVLTRPSGAWVRREEEHLADSTPVTLEGLPSGPVVLTLGAAEHRTVRVEVQVPKGDVALVEAALEKIVYGTLTLEVEPSDARVTPLDGSPYRPGMRLAEGEYRIRVTREGYREASRVVRVSGRTRVRIVLEPVPQPFTVVTTPPGAKVRFTDGSDYRAGMTLPSGTYRVRVSAEGWETEEAAVRHGIGPTRHEVALKRALTADEAKVLMEAGRVFRDCEGCPEMVVVPAGEYMMGSPGNEEGRRDREGPRHGVRIPRAFAVGKYEVTFEEWEACVAGGGCRGYRPGNLTLRRRLLESLFPSDWGRPPVTEVSWEDAKAYAEWLAEKTGKGYRLLTEAEWEYAARAGTTGPFHTGSTITTDQANYDGNYTYGSGSKGRYRERTVTVGTFPANGFGLHDVHGNASEWVEDCWHDDYSGAPTDGNAWSSGGDCGKRVLRGGSWFSEPKFLRSGSRGWNSAMERSDAYGFRIARTLTP